MKTIAHLLSYPFSVLFYLFFGFGLVIFHGIQWICFNLFGYQAHKKSVDILNLYIVTCLRVLGTRYSFPKKENLPKDQPILIVVNHQSLWDIPPIIWYLRGLHPKFVSKKELGKGLPSISYNLRHGGSVLIDRKKPRQALSKMTRFATYLSETKRSGVIFPEGTRSRTGEMKPFRRQGLTTLFKKLPNAYILPISINNSWKLQRFGMFPMPLFTHLTYDLHPILKVSEFDTETLIDLIETQIRSKVLES